MEYYLRRPETLELLRKTVLGDLLSLSDECSLDLANAAIKIVMDDCVEEVCKDSATWALSKENYVEAVQSLYKKIIKAAKRHVFGQDQLFVLQERTFQKDESIY